HLRSALPESHGWRRLRFHLLDRRPPPPARSRIGTPLPGALPSSGRHVLWLGLRLREQPPGPAGYRPFSPACHEPAATTGDACDRVPARRRLPRRRQGTLPAVTRNLADPPTPRPRLFAKPRHLQLPPELQPRFRPTGRANRRLPQA